LKHALEVSKRQDSKPIPTLFVHVPLAKGDFPGREICGTTVIGPFTVEELVQIVEGICWFVGQQAAEVRAENDERKGK
jgi:hypothetical protein